MAVDVKRLAAAQAHARMRQQDRMMQDVRQQQQYQNELGRIQYMQDRRSQKRGGIAKSVIGGLMTAGGAVASAMGAPMIGAPLIGAGAGQLTAGIGGITGNEGIQQAAPIVGQVGAGIAGEFGRRQQMGGLRDMMLEQQRGRTSAFNDAMGYGQYQQNLLSPEDYALRGATPVLGSRRVAGMGSV